eukprot:3500492-Rhodomonas_salina.2
MATEHHGANGVPDRGCASQKGCFSDARGCGVWCPEQGRGQCKADLGAGGGREVDEGAVRCGCLGCRRHPARRVHRVPEDRVPANAFRQHRPRPSSHRQRRQRRHCPAAASIAIVITRTVAASTPAPTLFLLPSLPSLHISPSLTRHRHTHHVQVSWYAGEGEGKRAVWIRRVEAGSGEKKEETGLAGERQTRPRHEGTKGSAERRDESGRSGRKEGRGHRGLLLPSTPAVTSPELMPSNRVVGRPSGRGEALEPRRSSTARSKHSSAWCGRAALKNMRHPLKVSTFVSVLHTPRTRNAQPSVSVVCVSTRTCTRTCAGQHVQRWM